MKNLVDEIKQLVEFKDTTHQGDIVLIIAKEPQMLVYAQVLKITRDTSRRDEWWHVELLFLSIPPQTHIWTLRTEQMTGQEIFTMGGDERFVKAIAMPVTEKPAENILREESVEKPFLKRVK